MTVGVAAISSGPVAAGPAVQAKAKLFPLSRVRLLAGPFRDAQETDRAFLLRLEPVRLLHWIRRGAGLDPGAEHYGGWDGAHAEIAGHYLTACAQMAAATGDPELRKRLDEMVAGLAEVQRVDPDGCLCDSPDSREWFRKLAAGTVQPRNTTPWYLVHKVMAGLRDAWLLCGSEQAREVLIRDGDACIRATARLTDEQWQEMLGPPGLQGEFGGPHEVLADLFAITGDRRYIDLAKRFRHALLFDALQVGDGSVLTGLHANSQFPKFIGYERIYQLTGERKWHEAAVNFWRNVTSERSWANGGNSQDEFFFPPADFSKKILEPCGPETCNTYNMLRLTESLYTMDPSVPYVDYFERGLYNHILASEAPGGGFVYYTSMRPGHYRIYSTPFDSCWCCVATGMENHGKYGRMIYASAPDRLFVNLFIPSTLKWPEAGLSLRQTTRFPDEAATHAVLTLKRPRRFTLSVRCPGWTAPDGIDILVNGERVRAARKPGSYADVTRTWRSGDRVDVTLPMRIRAEYLPHDDEYAALLYGPILLAAPLGAEGMTREDFYSRHGEALATRMLPLAKAPCIVGSARKSVAQIGRMHDSRLTFTLGKASRPEGLHLVPFYTIHFQRYAIYLPCLSQPEYDRRRTDLEAEEAQLRRLEERTLDRVVIGDAESERAHHVAGERTNTGSALPPYSRWRDGAGWFSYEMKTLPDRPVKLLCVYWGADNGRVFDVTVDGTVIATQRLTGSRPGEFVRAWYDVPESLTRGKERVTVRFEAREGTVAGGVFDLRTVQQQ
jgi:DUF1680 family protein